MCAAYFGKSLYYGTGQTVMYSKRLWLVLNLLMSLLQFVIVDCSSWSNQAQVAFSLLPQGVPHWRVKLSGVRQSKIL